MASWYLLPPIRIAVSANFTAEPLAEPLSHLLRLAGFAGAETHFAPFDQIFQTVFDISSVFHTSERGANVVLIEPATWRARDFSQLAEVLEHPNFRVPVILAPGPGAPSTAWPSPVKVIDHESIMAAHPGLNVHDHVSNRDGRIPFTTEYFAALAFQIARAVHSRLAEPVKVIAVDCDNTLWQGVCGEDGPEGVTGRLELQRFLVAQHSKGKLITLVSKNNEDDVWETFKAHPDWPLRPEHCVSSRINWDPKSANIASLAEELNLGLSAFALIDDDRRECGEVESNLPEVLLLPLPDHDVSKWLDHLWAFDQETVTDEDRQRNQYYSEISARARLERQAANFAEFIARLELKIEAAPITGATLSRAAQLTQRTNQMNLSTVRRTEAELGNALAKQELTGRVFQVSDRFGDYGVVGLLLMDVRGTQAIVDTMLLSCRALGRGVEHAMLCEAAQIANGATLLLRYTQTRKNAPALAFLQSIPTLKPCQGGFEASAQECLNLTFQPHESRQPVEQQQKPPKTAPPAQRGDYKAIAALAGDPFKLVQKPSKAQLQEPGTETERAIADIWAGLLKANQLKLDDDFFDLGGHSLLAVQLLSKLRERFPVDLSLDVVYAGKLTIRNLAAAIDNPIEGLSPEEYEALLAEAEQMTDEQIQELLRGAQ